MKKPLTHVIVVLSVAMSVMTGPKLSGSHESDATVAARDRFVGSWRLVWLEEAGADGNVPSRPSRFTSMAQSFGAWSERI